MHISSSGALNTEIRRGQPSRAEANAPCAFLLRRQRRVQADWAEVRSFMDELASRVAQRDYTVCVVSDAAMRRYNRQFRAHDETTDVLSFPAAAGGEEQYLGDILISAETAQKNAKRYGVRLEDEMKLLALHGVLHLLGYDHETDRGQMARQERLWAKRLGLPQSLTGRSRGRD